MPWLKVSDTAASHPVVLAPLADPQPWPAAELDPMCIVNLLFGIVTRCATQSAGYRTDYVVSVGTLAATAGAHWRHWAGLAEQAGYWEQIEVDGRPHWRILDDPDFVHIRLREEIEWERQRRADTANANLTVPVRLRDGDGCRYCGRIVTWGDQKGARGGTYDHRVPGQGAHSPDDLRVACRACNARRGDRADADEVLPPLPAPARPQYGPRTAAWLAEQGHRVPTTRTPAASSRRPSDPAASRTPQPRTPPAPSTQPGPAQRPGSQPDTAPARPAAPAAAGTSTTRPPRAAATPRPGPTSATAQRPGTLPDNAPRNPPNAKHLHAGRAAETADRQKTANPANRRSAGFGSPGRVRDGTGAPAPPPVPGKPSSPSRGRRARRNHPPPRGAGP